MPEPVDFDGLMADITKMQQVLGQVHGSLNQPRQKQVLGELMDRISQARAEAETAYPQAIKTIRESAERNQQEAQVLKEEFARKAQEYAAKDAEEKARPPAPKAPIRRPKAKGLPALALEPGSLLRKELLQRFGGAAAKKNASDDREIWEDWNWE